MPKPAKSKQAMSGARRHGGTSGDAVDRLAGVIGDLRENCLWTAALTHQSLMQYLVEETAELLEVVERPGALDIDELKGELADVLYQIMLHSLLEEEQGHFDLADVADALSEKLIRRNSHVFFPDGTLRATFPGSIAEIERIYEANKANEKKSLVSASIFASLPAGLPALSLAAKSIDRVEGRTGEVADQESAAMEAEIGRELFAVVSKAREFGIDAERALRQEILRYQSANSLAPTVE